MVACALVSDANGLEMLPSPVVSLPVGETKMPSFGGAEGAGGAGGAGGGGGGGSGAALTVTVAVALADAPTGNVAVAFSACEPLPSAVGSSRPSGSPLYW